MSLAIVAAVLTLTAGPALGARGGNGHGHGNVGAILATHGHGHGHGYGHAAGHGQGRGHRGAAHGAAAAANHSAARRKARGTGQVAAALGHGHGHGHAYGHLTGRGRTRGAARAGVLARAGAAHGAKAGATHGRGHAYGHIRGRGHRRRAALATVNRAGRTAPALVVRATRSTAGAPSAATHPVARTARRSAARDRSAAATGSAARRLAALHRHRAAAGAGVGAAAADAATAADATDGALAHLVAPVAIPTAASVARENAAAPRAVSTAHAAGIAAASGSGLIQIIEHIPLWLWVALVAALLFALLTGISALLTGRRARRQEGKFAALSAAALTDPLTGVLNRRGFAEAVERELARARRYGHPFVLAYVDVRGLKGVNDTEGHQVGDTLLQEAAAMLEDSARADDVVGRLGGDEMALLLVEQTSEGAVAVTERLQSEVAARRAELALRAPWALTVGTAAFPEDGENFDQLLRTADHRLYEQRGIELRSARVAPSRAPALP